VAAQHLLNDLPANRLVVILPVGATQVKEKHGQRQRNEQRQMQHNRCPRCGNGCATVRTFTRERRLFPPICALGMWLARRSAARQPGSSGLATPRWHDGEKPARSDGPRAVKENEWS